MLVETLRKEVLAANLELVRRGLVLYTFGNASGIDRREGLVVIKPSGVSYDELKPEDLVITDLSGKTVEGNFRPSSDLPTHLVLYKHFPAIGGARGIQKNRDEILGHRRRRRRNRVADERHVKVFGIVKHRCPHRGSGPGGVRGGDQAVPRR